MARFIIILFYSNIIVPGLFELFSLTPNTRVLKLLKPYLYHYTVIADSYSQPFQ